MPILHPYHLRQMIRAAVAANAPRAPRIHTMKQPRSLSGTYARDRWNRTAAIDYAAEMVEVTPQTPAMLDPPRPRPAIEEELRAAAEWEAHLDAGRLGNPSPTPSSPT